MNNVDRAKRNADLILPKLEALRSSVGGGKIHDLNQHLAILSGLRGLLNMDLKRNSPEDVASDLLEGCRQAEKFLQEAAR